MDSLVEYRHARRCVINPTMNNLCTSYTDNILGGSNDLGDFRTSFSRERTSDFFLSPTTQKEKQNLIGFSAFEDEIPHLGILMYILSDSESCQVVVQERFLVSCRAWQI